MSKHEVSNSDDVIDSRDVIARIEELTAEREALQDELDNATDDGKAERITLAEWDADNAEELAALIALQDEAEGYAADWHHGEILIRDSYFKDYAQELADDIGAVPKDLSWPCNCIDWDQAARDLRMDYSAVDFGGITYWVR